jgi:hypothetical protein
MAVAPRILFVKKPAVTSLLPYLTCIFIIVECIAIYYLYLNAYFNLFIGVNLFMCIALICYNIYIFKFIGCDIILLKQIAQGSIKDANYKIRQILNNYR